MRQPRAILVTQGLSKEFQGFRAVSAVDLRVTEGTVHALVGPNGAGKTTLFNLLTGFLRPSGGRITFAGHDITGQPPERIAGLGVARSFQVTSLFAQMTAREHVELALQSGTGLGRRFWRTDKLMRRFSGRALELLGDVGLEHLADRPAGNLPYGQKRALELALALALDPALLLLDEPTAGMGLEDVDRTVALIDRIREGRTVVMVEHNMSVVGSLADTVTVLQRGEVLVEGPYDRVRTDPRVVEAYLGADVA
ncbi:MULTISPECIES: ABC transporter ATP-binding protein [Streptomyces]|jgi:ABC-type branched-chain amino acid transport systems, ATPase component|uniref:ABC transporter ATP-binding protein n=1 Tax=Streptomyces mirabilis TaxID=68239 RepID=A0ABU3UUF0_9ACTN|nr:MULTISPECIES: ABC transporter ATP-binding protein [Streptomyces]MCX5349052.1 ABC transporter ATP-binding protein [Streptomyces mirabilis]MDU8997555.1 ABC transporter ATP-binding protein [Streptomyces mirabilis]NMI58130.1 ABC transporter ATP-binding protein [Streptomyces sp. RLA2-12]QDN57516.1 ABC transporter ATP-binding protein [Streptomyces sp. S1D4-20]QDN67613.1 ABC transporter ATP-binding protein [Streptomyces sp. S1D4-14]